MKIDVSIAITKWRCNLIDEGLIEDCPQYLLENAIYQWLENFIENLPTDIEHFYKSDNFPSLKKCLNNIDTNDQINEDDEISLIELYPDGIDLSEILAS